MQASAFPDIPFAVPNEFIVTFASVSGRARGKAAVANSSDASLLHEYSLAVNGLALRTHTPRLLARLILSHPEVLSVEPNGVKRAIGTQTGLTVERWGLDRIDQVGHGLALQTAFLLHMFRPLVRVCVCVRALGAWS
jgi:hypothetical protein